MVSVFLFYFRKVKHLLLITLFCLAGTTIVNSQDDDLPPPRSKPEKRYQNPDDTKPEGEFVGFKKRNKLDWSKFILEPNINFSISQNQIDLGLSPYVGYQVWAPKKGKTGGLYAGGGVTYFYTRINVQSEPIGGKVYYGKAQFHTYGGGVFLQYNIWRGFFARTRFEVLHRTLDDLNNATINVNPNNGSYKIEFAKIQRTIPAMLIGVGYNLLQSKNFFFPIMISYNVLSPITDRRYSIYQRGVVVQLGFINIF